MNPTVCQNPDHPKFDDGFIHLCLLCHWRTDEAFAIYSRAVLNRAKTGTLVQAQ